MGHHSRTNQGEIRGREYTVLKTRRFPQKIREEVPWREKFPILRGYDDYFPRITRHFSYRGLPPRKLARNGTNVHCSMFRQSIEN